MTDENGTITREYDCMDRVTKYTDFRGNVVKYSYDTLGNLVTLEYAGGRIVRYSYYPTGRLKNVVDWNNRTTNYEYDGNGRLTKLIRPDGSIETYQYDALGQLIEQTDINGGKVINSFTYTYDTAGHIIKTESQNVAEETISVSSATMQYDAANRLIKYNGEDVEYDADGNMTYGPLDGVMTHFAYDCRNRLVSAGNTTYEYDAENNRIAVVVNNVRTDYVVENNASVYSQLTNGELTYAPSVKGEERELYFLTDVGTIKGGHHLEDKNRCVLYEAKMTKFSPLSAFAFDFIDHENNKTTKHLVGHAEEWTGILSSSTITTPLPSTVRTYGSTSERSASPSTPASDRRRASCRAIPSARTARNSRMLRPRVSMLMKRTPKRTRSPTRCPYRASTAFIPARKALICCS